MSKITLDFFQENLTKNIQKICDKIKANDELEVSFGSTNKPISLKKFYNLLKYINLRSNKNKLKTENTKSLDIIYNYDEKTNSSFRLTIEETSTNNELQRINSFIQDNKLLKNNIMFSRLVRTYIDQNDVNEKKDPENKIILINKIKSPDKFIALNEYDMRIKLSEEISDIEQSVLNNLLKIEEQEKNHIDFRFKQRVSLFIEDNAEYTIRIDLTDVKDSKNINYLTERTSKYELEIDITFKKSVQAKKIGEICDKLASQMFNVEQFLQESLLLTTKTESNAVIKNLNKLAYDDENETYKDLPAMQTASVDIQNILDTIPGNYSITDKADGERYFLMIFNDKVYLISNNLDVKKIKNDIKSSDYNSTVIDGEYLYVPRFKKYLFLSFDILFFQGKDVRTIESLKDRLLLVNKLLKDEFDVDIDIGTYTKEYNTEEMYKYHSTNIKNHLDQLNKNLSTSPYNQVIYGKYFIFPMTVSLANDIYALTTILYESYTLNTKLSCPYTLDGIIYTPINQKYTRNQGEIKFKILKWKPENKNSIDFYVQYERNHDTNKIVTVFDRTNQKSLEDYIENKKQGDVDFNDMEEYKVKNSAYQILNLFVGKIKNNQETPVPFQKENDLNQSYIYINNGYARDIENNIILDSTVVEFSYNDNVNIPENFRWIPLRTRFDKTESVMRFQRKYGNNYEIANRVWNSIQHPITFDDIKLLGDPKTNQNQVKVLKSKISAETISLSRRSDAYYQLITNIGKPIRNFHNWLKSNMIYTYCSKKTLLDSNIVKMDVLDIGVGRGGDLMKFYHAKIKSAVCFDINEAGIFSGSDGAISRYNVMKKKMPGFPKMSFLVADAGQKLEYVNQSKIIQMNEQNIKLSKQIFGDDENSKNYSTFDVINAQFMIHYLLRDIITWNNFCHNVKKYLRPNGYLLITTLDGQSLNNSFVNDHIRKDYITEDGIKRPLFDIIKKYPELDIKTLKTEENNLGIQLDVHISIFMDEGVYQTEYLVNPSFLIQELKTKCGLRLVETESFQNLYYVYQDFFNNTSQFESKIETRKFFNDVKQFYNQNDELNKNWFEFSKLNRYYIFQKLD